MKIFNDISTRFYDETEAEDILSAFDNVCEALDIHPERWAQIFFLQTFNNIELNVYITNSILLQFVFHTQDKRSNKMLQNLNPYFAPKVLLCVSLAFILISVLQGTSSFYIKVFVPQM